MSQDLKKNKFYQKTTNSSDKNYFNYRFIGRLIAKRPRRCFNLVHLKATILYIIDIFQMRIGELQSNSRKVNRIGPLICTVIISQKVINYQIAMASISLILQKAHRIGYRVLPRVFDCRHFELMFDLWSQSIRIVQVSLGGYV
jgi:hypothetical protein